MANADIFMITTKSITAAEDRVVVSLLMILLVTIYDNFERSCWNLTMVSIADGIGVTQIYSNSVCFITRQRCSACQCRKVHNAFLQDIYIYTYISLILTVFDLMRIFNRLTDQLSISHNYFMRQNNCNQFSDCAPRVSYTFRSRNFLNFELSGFAGSRSQR